MHPHNDLDLLGTSIDALTSFLALTQSSAGTPVSRPDSLDFVPDVELSRSFHCMSTLLSRYHSKRSWECVDIAVTGSLKVDKCNIVAVVKELPDTPDLPLVSQNGVDSENGKANPSEGSGWRVQALKSGGSSSQGIGASLKEPLPYHEYAERLLSTFIAFREAPSHAIISSLHQIAINQNVETLLHLVSLQSKLWDPPLFSLLTHWQPIPSDLEYLKSRAGYYPIDPYISTLLDRCDIPKQKPPGTMDEDEGDNYLLNYDTVAKWVHAPAMLFNALQKYLAELSLDPKNKQKCSTKETREDTLANLVTCLRVLHAYIYKTHVVTDVLFGVPSLTEMVKRGSIIDGDRKVHRHRRRRTGSSRRSYDEKEMLADLEDSFESIEELDVDPWLEEEEDEMEGDTTNEHAHTDTTGADPAAEFTLHYLRSILQYQDAVSALTNNAVLLLTDIPIELYIIHPPSIYPSPSPNSSARKQSLKRALLKSLENDVLPSIFKKLRRPSTPPTPAMLKREIADEAELSRFLKDYVAHTIGKDETILSGGGLQVHPEAWIMSLVFKSLSRAGRSRRKDRGPREGAVPEEVVRLFNDASGVIGTPRKPCWSCHFLADHLHLKHSNQPLFTLPPLPSVTPTSSLAATNARIRPWKTPGDLRSKAVRELYEKLCGEAEEVLMKEVKWREKASLAEKWARRRREGGESDGGCWMA